MAKEYFRTREPIPLLLLLWILKLSKHPNHLIYTLNQLNQNTFMVVLNISMFLITQVNLGYQYDYEPLNNSIQRTTNLVV